jgi:hypothetical protein
MRSQGAPPPDPEEPSRQSQEEERFGPLRLRRITKPDGRALIFYSRADPPEVNRK